MTFFIPIEIAVKDPTITPNPTKNFVFNLFILSTFPSVNACNKSMPVNVNQPPANVNRKVVNLFKIPCVFTPNLSIGFVSDDCIFFSNSLSFPSLKPSSANCASLFLFSNSFFFSNSSLIAKLSFIIASEEFTLLT